MSKAQANAPTNITICANNVKFIGAGWSIPVAFVDLTTPNGVLRAEIHNNTMCVYLDNGSQTKWSGHQLATFQIVPAEGNQPATLRMVTYNGTSERTKYEAEPEMLLGKKWEWESLK